jgi:hypothetical protein
VIHSRLSSRSTGPVANRISGACSNQVSREISGTMLGEIDPSIQLRLSQSTRRVDREVVTVIILALAGTDFLTHSVNLSILYTIPAFVLARRLPAHLAALVVLLLIGLTYAGLFLGPRPPGLETVPQLVDNYRIVNRSFAVVAIACTGFIAAWEQNWTAGMRSRIVAQSVLEERTIYLDLMKQVRTMAALLLGVLMTGAVVAIDWSTPPEFNWPILYALPLVLCLISGSPRLVLLMMPVLLVLTWGGFFASVEELPSGYGQLVLGRLIATAMLLMLAGVGVWRMVAERRKGMP